MKKLIQEIHDDLLAKAINEREGELKSRLDSINETGDFQTKIDLENIISKLKEERKKSIDNIKND